MRGAVRPGTGRPYPLTMICAVWRVSRSTVSQAMAPARSRPSSGRSATEDDGQRCEIIEAIRAVLVATPFHGEGYRKVRARLAHGGSPCVPAVDARPSAARAAAPRAPQRRPGPRGDDHHGAAE